MPSSFAKLLRLKSVFNWDSTMIALRFLMKSRGTLRTCLTMILKFMLILAEHLPHIIAERRIMKTSIRAAFNFWLTHLLLSWAKLKRKTGRSNWAWQFYWVRTSTTSWSYSIKKFFRAWSAQISSGFMSYWMHLDVVKLQSLSKQSMLITNISLVSPTSLKN